MNDTKKLNVLPGLVAGAVLLAIAALVAAVVAIGKSNDKAVDRSDRIDGRHGLRLDVRHELEGHGAHGPSADRGHR